MPEPERRFFLALLLTAALGGAAWAQDRASAPVPVMAPVLAPAPAPAPAPVSAPLAPAVGEAVPGRSAHEEAGRCVEGTELTCMDLVRRSKDGKERRIMVIRTGSDDSTGIYTLCTPQEDEPEDAPNVGVFSESGEGGIRIVIDKNLIQAPLAVVTQLVAQSGGEQAQSEQVAGQVNGEQTNGERANGEQATGEAKSGAADEGSDGKVEASSGTARFLDEVPEGQTDRLSRCGVAVERRPQPGTVKVTQGKTRLTGQTLDYDGADGIARIAGPITFQRDDQEDPLSGESRSIEINVDTEATVLVGDVVLRSGGGRVSKAGRVEYDDQANTARLYATPEQPAESVRGNDVLRISSGVIVYNLEENEVYANAGEGGNISGEFQDEAAPGAAP